MLESSGEFKKYQYLVLILKIPTEEFYLVAMGVARASELKQLLRRF